MYDGNAKQTQIVIKKQCTRCQKKFTVNHITGDYIYFSICQHHSGKFQRESDTWECCHANGRYAVSCEQSEFHIWSGVNDGFNGPFLDFVETRKQSQPNHCQPKAYSIDCEMVYTKHGPELAQITLLELDGNVKYESLVKPESQVLDYATRFSGITKEDLDSVTTKLKDVQESLLNVISADTILIGHGLENDFRALKLMHYSVIDEQYFSIKKNRGPNLRPF